MKIFIAVAVSVIFLILLLVFYYIHIRFFLVDVVFYSAILDGVLSTFTTGIIIFLHKYFSVFSIFEKLQMIIIFLFAGYIFAISIPTIIDRSLSFYILEKLHQRGGAINLSSFDDIIKNEYMVEHRLVDVRITEQENSGTINIKDGCVRLTNRGEKIVKFSLFFRKNFLPKKRLIMGKYTDELTDPFRSSKKEFDYVCN